ncbi:hypothetical protein D9M71_607910 [compost metagenome]
MGKKRSEITGVIGQTYPQPGELVSAEIEFFKEELMSVEPQGVAVSYELAGLSE